MEHLIKGKKIIDLTVTNDELHPCWWPTVPPFQAKTFCWYTSWLAPCYTRVLTIEEHVGTHFDAPAHYIPDPKYNLPHSTPSGSITADKVPLNQLMGPADVIDVSELTGKSKPGVSPIITVDYIESWEKEYGNIEKEDVVLIRTAFSDQFYKTFPEGTKYSYDPIMYKTSPAWPGLDVQSVNFLFDRGVRLVGIDASSIGPFGTGIADEAHRAGLGKGMVFVESLIHLAELPSRGAFFIFLPIKCEGGSGAPGRAVALIDEN